MGQASTTRVDGRKLVLLLGCVLAGALLWDQPALLPLKLLVVMMHETGHAVASLLVGGSVDQVTLVADQSGACLSRLPAGVFRQVVVYSAGYLGSTLAGGVLILATYRLRLGRWVLGGASAWLVVMGVLYVRDAFTLAFCAGMAVVLGLAARFLPEGGVAGLNLFLAAFSALYAVRDLKDDLWDSTVRARSDAALLADLTYIPALVWAVLWTLGSLGLLFVFAHWSLTRRAPVPGRAR